MQIQMMKLSEIHPYEKNPRFNDGAVEAVANSIKEFGFLQPIVVDKDFVVVVGHTRLKAAEQLGLTEVPVVIAHGSSGGDRGKTTLLSLNGVLWKNLLGIF